MEVIAEASHVVTIKLLPAVKDALESFLMEL